MVVGKDAVLAHGLRALPRNQEAPVGIRRGAPKQDRQAVIRSGKPGGPLGNIKGLYFMKLMMAALEALQASASVEEVAATMQRSLFQIPVNRRVKAEA